VGKVILHDFTKFQDVNSHIVVRQCLEPCERAANEFLRGFLPPDESLEMGCGELNEGLETVPVLGVLSHRVPKSFEDFVALPPVGEIEEVNRIEVRRGLMPIIWMKR
jgi:hypothetical protein